MTIKKIVLELARDHDFPNGSRAHGYRFTAPLTDDGRIDPEAWKTHRDQCRVVRFWGDEEDEVGHLIRKPGGSWAFHYDIHGDEDSDESGYRFALHVFKPGEYLSIKEHDEEMRTFKVIAVSALS
ncbi:MAG: hypothetical protein HKN05_12785 [Rhizobiales bacterium]|nr:hypothetical protein [Hyphomicrobiales bacterium]